MSKKKNKKRNNNNQMNQNSLKKQNRNNPQKQNSQDNRNIYNVFIYIFSFFIPAIIYFIILWKQDFLPNGTKTVLFMDLKEQYTAFLASLRNIFNSDSSMFFNWSRSMGGNMLGLYAYYSGGPLSLITCLFPVSKMYVAIEVLEIIEIGLCGLTFSVFLNRGVSKSKNDFGVIVFATCYALMSYNMVYAACYMWMEGLIILPLVMLGIERIFEGKKGALFYFTLCYAMFSNYYTAYMICLFTIFYVIFRYAAFLHEKRTLKTLGIYSAKYAGMAILSAMTVSPVLICVYKDLSSGKLSSKGNVTQSTELFEFSKLFTKFLNGKYDSIATEGLPSVYCGMLMVFLAVIFFCFIKKGIMERIVAALIIFVMFMSFWQNKLDVIWHGFQMPNWFPWRYSFLLSFFLVYLAYRAYEDMDFIWKKAGKAGYACMVVILLIVCSTDMYFNGAACVKGLGEQFGYADKSEYDSFMDKTMPLVKEMKKDKSMYRVASDKVLSMNDALLLNYNGMTHYSSTYNADVNNITNRMGYAQTWFWNSGDGAAPVTDALFGIKYRMTSGDMSNGYSLIKENKGLSLYENKNALPLCYPADNASTQVKAESEDIFANQNAVLSSFVGEEKEYYVKAKNPSNNIFVAGTTGPMFACVISDGSERGSIIINNNKNILMEDLTRGIYLGEYHEGEPVNIDIRLDEGNYRSLYIYSLDEELFEKDIESLKKHAIKITAHKGGKLKGTIETDANEQIVTSIPYDDGFTIKVDGKKVKYEKYMDSFITFKTGNGKHDISISYTPPGFMTGIFAGVVAIALFVVYATGLVLHKKK